MGEIRLDSCWWGGSRRGWRTVVSEEQRGNCSCEWALGWFLRCSTPSETKETHSPFLEPDISCAGQTPTFLVPRVLNCSRISNCVHLPPTADSRIARQTQTQILAGPFTSCVTSGKLQPTKVSASSSVKWGKAIRTFTWRLLQSHAAESRTCNSYYISVVAQSQLWIQKVKEKIQRSDGRNGTLTWDERQWLVLETGKRRWTGVLLKPCFAKTEEEESFRACQLEWSHWLIVWANSEGSGRRGKTCTVGRKAFIT